MKVSKKFAALALAGAMVAAVLGSAQAAQADQITGGTITVTPTSGNVNTDEVFLSSIATNVGAPAGYRASSGTVLFQGGVNLGSVATVRTPATTLYGETGLTGNPVAMDRVISPTNNFVSNKLINATTTPLQSGPFELRMYFFAVGTSPDYVNDKFIKLDMTYDAATGAWSVYTAPTAAIVTTTAITAGTTANAGEVTLSATVKDGAATATAAAGNIVFKEGTTTVATVPVASGAASALLTGVADGAHSYTAEFAPSNAVYGASASAAATVNVGSPAPQAVQIQVAIPAGIGSLTLTGVSSSVNLGTAALAGGTLNATGTLNAVVTDTRQLEYPAWNLTGQVGNFTSGTKTLDGKYLGWTPAKTGDATNSVAGAVVAAAGSSGDGLKTSSVLVSGAPFANGTVTNASAVLQLKAPSNTPPGAYTATLTLTLI